MTTTPDLWRNPFLDNTSLTGDQDSGVVAPTNANQFFAVWRDSNLTPDDIIARKFDSLGNPITPEVNITSGPDFPPFGGETGEPAAVRLPIAGQADGLAVALTDFSGTDDIFVVRADANLNFLGFTGIKVGGPDASRPSITSF